jgi:hypothetical protein
MKNEELEISTYKFTNLFRNIFMFLLLTTLVFTVACDITELNQISTKKIENQATGKTEEYRTIKISEDAENDYFLDIKIPDGYQENEPQFGNFLTVYRFSKGEANQYAREGILISKTISNYDLPMMQHIEGYAAWVDSNYRKLKGNPIFKDVAYGHEGSVDEYNIKTYTLKYIFPCSHMKNGSICFSGQKEVYVTKLFKPNEIVWAVEYGNLISPLNNPDYEKTVQEKFEEGKKIINDCCKITTIKKLPKNLK